jgi:N-acetylmuramoyl-L-alanine amidase
VFPLQVRRFRPVLALVAVAAFVAVTGPALSLSRYRPKPVDFELAPAAVTAAGGPVTSKALRAPKRFNLVGMRWRGRAAPRLALRVRKAGGRWTRWVPVSAEYGPSSAPVWVGEADQVQYRSSRALPGLRLHFVNVEGTATAADRARTSIRRAVNTAALSLGRVLGARAAQAQPPGAPAMVMRSGWGAQDCPPRSGAQYGQVKAAYVHHTVSINDYSREEAPDIVLSICRYHRNSNGWNDIGYNFLVDKYGTLYEGRAGGIDKAVVGAQAQGYNSQTTGIANIGTYSGVPVSQQALSSMAALIRWKLPLHGQPTAGTTTLKSAGGDTNRYPSGRTITVDRVIGHRDTNSTECPGEALYNQLTQLRAMVGDTSPAPVLKPPDSRSRTSVAAALAPRFVSYGRRARISGRLRRAGGRRLSRKPLQVQVLRGRTWRTAAQARTGSSGAFSVKLRPRVTRLVRVRFPGDGTLRPSASKAVQLVVLPVVALSRHPVSARAGGRVAVAGTVKPAKSRLVLIVQLRRRGRWLAPGYKGITAAGGRFSIRFRPGRRGAWRYSVATIADRSHGRGRTRVYPLEVR